MRASSAAIFIRIAEIPLDQQSNWCIYHSATVTWYNLAFKKNWQKLSDICCFSNDGRSWRKHSNLEIFSSNICGFLGPCTIQYHFPMINVKCCQVCNEKIVFILSSHRRFDITSPDDSSTSLPVTVSLIFFSYSRLSRVSTTFTLFKMDLNWWWLLHVKADEIWNNQSSPRDVLNQRFIYASTVCIAQFESFLHDTSFEKLRQQLQQLRAWQSRETPCMVISQKHEVSFILMFHRRFSFNSHCSQIFHDSEIEWN